MAQTSDRLQVLLNAYFEQSITAVEQVELWGYINDEAYSNKLMELLPDAYNSDTPSLISELSTEERNNILAYIHAFEESVKDKDSNKNKIRIKKLWISIAAAAALILISTLGILIYQNSKTQNEPEIVLNQDIAPGKIGATLTLANGKKILLTDVAAGKLANESGVTITKTKDGELLYEINEAANTEEFQYNTLATINGETQRIKLQDGTVVYLNAASSLTYPSSFAKSEKRKVQLKGEGYFEVAKDKQHPFIVSTDGQDIEVLGTHFNINAYSDEPKITTTLLEGIIAVSKGTERKTILPGYAAITSNTNKGLTIKAVDTEIAVAWKNEQFLFDQENIQPIMRMIARWYNVEVIYEGTPITGTFSGGLSRFDKLSKALKSLTSTGLLHFRLEGRKLYVSK